MSYRKAFKKTSFLFLRPVIQTTLGAWSTYTYNPVTSRGARSAMKSKPLARILSAQSVTRSNKHGPKYSSWQTLQRFPSFLYRRHSSAGKISRLPFASLCRFTKVKQMFTRVGKWIHNGVALALGAVLPTNQLLMECLPLSICRRRELRGYYLAKLVTVEVRLRLGLFQHLGHTPSGIEFKRNALYSSASIHVQFLKLKAQRRWELG